MVSPQTQTQLFAHEFVLTAGAILFRRAPDGGGELQVCILHHLRRDAWLLPKGRKDRGETLEASALRETYEETGFPCRALPVRMWTRAPRAGADTKDAPALAADATEPFAVTLRPGGKFIWWYIAEATGAPQEAGTQMRSEAFASAWVSVEEALRRLAFVGDRELVERAAVIVRESGYCSGGGGGVGVGGEHGAAEAQPE